MIAQKCFLGWIDQISKSPDIEGPERKNSVFQINGTCPVPDRNRRQDRERHERNDD